MRKGQGIYGIDFSGAQDAGNKIWIANGVPKGKGLLIKECFSARDLPNSGSQLEVCLPALVGLIKSNQNAVFGFDFPFGLPRTFVQEETWVDFVVEFPKKHASPEAFRDACRQANRGRELKRQTDIQSHTPFSPYNLRLFKQTYYGISKVLYPLVRDKSASILPFDKPVAGKPRILEVCPASTLKHLMEKGVPSYKGPEEDKRENRRQILEIVMKEGVAFVKGAVLEEKIIDNKRGDALDSVIAALAAFKAVKDEDTLIPDDDGYWKIEGYVYV
jgi:hypothetical protein